MKKLFYLFVVLTLATPSFSQSINNLKEQLSDNYWLEIFDNNDSINSTNSYYTLISFDFDECENSRNCTIIQSNLYIKHENQGTENWTVFSQDENLVIYEYKEFVGYLYKFNCKLEEEEFLAYISIKNDELKISYFQNDIEQIKKRYVKREMLPE